MPAGDGRTHEPLQGSLLASQLAWSPWFTCAACGRPVNHTQAVYRTQRFAFFDLSMTRGLGSVGGFTHKHCRLPVYDGRERSAA